MPWLDGWLAKNPWCPIEFASFEAAAVYSYQKLTERKVAIAKGEEPRGD